MAKYSKADQAAALANLRSWLKPGDTLHTICDHVSRSGMSRNIRVVIIDKDGGTTHPNWAVACVLGYSQAKRGDGIVMTGCGMDMGFALVYELSSKLFPDGFGIEGVGPHGHKVRPATKEKAAEAIAKGYKFRGRNGDTSGWDTSGGYAIKQAWL